MPALNGLPRGPRSSRCRSGWSRRLDASPSPVAITITPPPVPLPRPFQFGRPGEPAQVCDGHPVKGLRVHLPAVRVGGRHEPENVLAPEGVTDHHVGEPVVHERTPAGGIGIDVAARLQNGEQAGLRLGPGLPPERRIHGVAQALHEMLNDLGPTGRSRADLPMEVAQEHDAVAAADPLLVELEVFLGMALPQQRQHFVGQSPQGQLVLARDLQGGQQPLKNRVPDVALRGRHVAAGEQHHVAARDQPVMASFALLLHVGLDAVVAQGRIAADVAALHVRRDHLAEHPGEFLGQSVGVHADRHQGNPQPDVIAVMRAEPAGACPVLLELLPVGRVLKPVHPPGMKKSLPVDR